MSKKLAIPLLLVLSLTLSCGKANSSNGGEGTGMFEFPSQSEITITYNEKEIQVSDPDKIQEIIDLCKNYDWPTANSASYNKEDCDVWIDFNTDRAVIGLVSGSSNGILNDVAVILPDSLNDIINSIVNA